jgi:hypothetical protein
MSYLRTRNCCLQATISYFYYSSENVYILLLHRISRLIINHISKYYLQHSPSCIKLREECWLNDSGAFLRIKAMNYDQPCSQMMTTVSRAVITLDVSLSLFSFSRENARVVYKEESSGRLSQHFGDKSHNLTEKCCV